ncbi:MAG: hypothetical protein WA061_02505 [Microgenomates group bacterium]
MTDFRFLAIWRYDKLKIKLEGFKIFETLEEIQELEKHYKSIGKIDFNVGGAVISYENYDELMKDVEVLPVVKKYSDALQLMFEDTKFGIFPI